MVAERPPLLLALDTATAMAGVAVYDGSRVLVEVTWLAGREHSTGLLVELEHALARAGRQIGDATGLAVARGPGSFTGVRVALSVAKGLAAGLSIPVWGISTLDVLAHAASFSSVPVRPIVDAGRNRVATALYRDGQQVEALRAVATTHLAELCAEPTLLIGDLTEAMRSDLAGVSNARLASPAACARRSGYLAELGWRARLQGDPGDARHLDALYVPSAV